MNEAEDRDALEGDTAVVLIAQTMVEAKIAEAALRAAGVPCILQDFSLNPYDGLWVVQKGWGRILVSKKDLARSREIISEALEPRPLADEDEWEAPESAVPPNEPS